MKARYNPAMHFGKISLYCLLLLTLAPGCDHKETAAPALFEEMKNTGIAFTNSISNKKDFNIFSYRNYYNGGGVAIGDINNDGLADVFFTANMGANKLFLNKGNWNFDDISQKAGFTDKPDWSTGVVMVDINNDGWLDIYVCNAGYVDGQPPRSQLFINNHDLTFREEAASWGLQNEGGYATHAAFFDYDLDGDLDCFIINNSFIPVNTLNYANRRDLRAADWPVKDFLKGGGDRLLRNDDGHFTDVSREAGIYGSLMSFGLGVTVGDVNGDRYPDIYVSNDFFERDYLYINQGNGTFRDELESWVQHTSLSSMGADMADVNNDGLPDIFTTDMLPGEDQRLKRTTSFENIDVYRLKQKNGFYNQFTQNTLQINDGNGNFCETAFMSGVAASDWSWGGLIFDMDNDGWSDIYVCNGIYHDVTDQDFIDFFADNIIQRMVFTGKKEEVDSIINKMPSTPILNKAFRNMGQLRFSDAGKKWGFTTPSFSNGAAYGDLDNDGDLDLVINNVNEPAFIYRNRSRELDSTSGFISIQLKGQGTNTFAIGSLIRVYAGDQMLTRELIPTRGFQSSVDYKQVIGLGQIKKIDSVVVVWPDRTVENFGSLPLQKLHTLTPGSNRRTVAASVNNGMPAGALFSRVETPLDAHQEDDYIDFYIERNIPELLSAEGPRIARADVNGDGREDIYIGGAAGQAGQLYLNTANGFVKSEQPVFNQFSGFEDVAVLFFDADRDGDMDLYIGAGGNNVQPGVRELQHRLYINNGKGQFTLGSHAFPVNGTNIAVALAYDFDGDGDEDLFIGSRSVPYQYGAIPSSYLFVNDGQGHFSDQTARIFPELQTAGMITSAVFTDLDQDGRKELVLAGTWMQPRIFQYNPSRSVFEEWKHTGLEQLHGWWQTVTAADINGDGKADLVLGNIGKNFYLQPRPGEPIKLWLNDFDHNGQREPFITHRIDGRDMPVFTKKDITDQFPSLKKQNLRHVDYADKSITDLFGEKIVGASASRNFDYNASIVAINKGDGSFDVQELPLMTQLSSVNAITIADVDGNGTQDLVVAGNMFGFPPQFGRLDANYGLVLLNDGSGKFTVMKPAAAGLQIRGAVKDMALVKTEKGNLLLVAINNAKPQAYLLNRKEKSK